MKPIRNLFLLALAAVCVAAYGDEGCTRKACCPQDLTQYVDQYIGTGGHGHVFMGANVPFGMVQLGPTQPASGWDWCSGYHYSDSIVRGIAHTHLNGTGIGDLGDVALLPVAREDQQVVKFSHKQESAAPGYYSLSLADPQVRVELTATKRAGFHRYSYAQKRDVLMRLDLKQGIGWDALSESGMRQECPRAISGHRRSTGWAKDQQVFFYAEFSTPVEIASPNDSIVVLRIADASRPVLVKVGLSAVSVEGAKANLKAEIPGWDFDGTVLAARRAWNDELSKIRIETTDEAKRTIFYTAMYHTMVAPSVFSDVDGQYRGADGKVYKGDFTNYTTFSLWDTYRAAMPLLTLIHPEKCADMAQTLLHIYKQQGKLPVWHLWGNETDCMVGCPGVAVMGDLTLKGFTPEADKTLALEAMKKSMLMDERGLGLLQKYGYIPTDLDPTFETVAKGLEYALADAGVAKVAKMLGQEEDYKLFYQRSQNYRRLFDRKTGFMRGVKSDGSFRTPFNPFNAIHRQDDYTEGNAWQYAWLVPHDVHGLASLFGSEKRFTAKLDSLFIVSGDMGAEASPDISGLIGQYAHGNEPSHHILYMYNYVGQPWKGAHLLRQTMETMYHNDFDGLSGNEDVGQMSAWYILSSLGLYQVEPEGGRFIIGSPIFDKATVSVGDGKTLTVEAAGNSAENKYVQSATWNGEPYTRSYIDYRQLREGGTLRLVMGSKPSKWGTAKKDRP